MSQKSETPATTSTPESFEPPRSLSEILKNRLSPERLQRQEESLRDASDLVKASPILIGYLKYLPLEEVERRARCAQCLAKILSTSPFYAERAKRIPDYWNKFYTGRPNWCGCEGLRQRGA